ncbi:MAG: kynureninase [Phycisphaerales bacterium]|nr:kynureninase [Phycisphaerales bacterium]
MTLVMESPTTPFGPTEADALALDAADPLRGFRDRFSLPRGRDGAPQIYLCGNSLGLQPKATRDAVLAELDDWARLGVEAHFHGRHPWYPYHEFVRETGARLVGAQPHEIVYMNSLTVNLHLMMVTFYRPTSERYKILIEDAAFPSDTYAVRTQIRIHGRDPDDALLVAKPRLGEKAIRTEDVEALLEREGSHIALVLMSGVNYFSGQVFDMRRIAAAARRHGARVGFDLAHAAGNVELCLHDWNVDFAAWCTYKYLNSGPGAVAGCFVHERNARDASLPRLGGWWGNDPKTRFRMHLEPEFVPVPTADAWQLSNPPILALAPVRVSLGIFDEAGMPALRAKSEKLTAYLQFLLDRMPSERYTTITPPEKSQRGAQFSLLAHDRPRELFRELEAADVVCDFREPNVIRVAPVPLYNTFHDVWRFAKVLSKHA